MVLSLQYSGMIFPAPAPPEQRVRLSMVPWETYVSFTDGLGPSHVRVTYDRGEMEIMTVSSEHERAKTLLARLIESLTEELNIDIAGAGSMTFRREDLQRALEGDECYWIANEAKIRGRVDIDVAVDPPPDLMVEVEISRSLLSRMSLLASLGVPEVWRWDGEVLRVAVLSPAGVYEETDRSKAFPFLPLAEFGAFLRQTGVSETQLIRSFREWVKRRSGQNWSA
jgi:Uma2 family endonuclease